MTHKNIILAVDDFGINQSANDAILRLIQMGRIDRVSIMVNGTIRPDEITSLLDAHIALDIHLDIDDDLQEERLSGFFGRLFRFIREYLIGNYRAKNALMIWEKQILEFQRLFGQLPDGLNTHQHVHFFPPLFGAIMKLATTYEIRYIRLGRRSSGIATIIAFALDCLRRFNRRRLNRSGIDTSDYLISADWIPDLNVATRAAKLPQNARIEAVYHPERPEEYLFLRNYVLKK